MLTPRRQITQGQFRNLEFLRMGFGLVPEARDPDPGTAVLVPSRGAAGNSPYKSCTCSAAKKRTCRHQRDLAHLVPEFRKALGGRECGEVFAGTLWHALGEILFRSEPIPCADARVLRVGGDGKPPCLFASGGGRELLRWLDGSPCLERFTERVGLHRGATQTGRAGTLRKLGLLVRSETEQGLNAAGLRSHRQAWEESFWGRLAYHLFLEYGDGAGSFEPGIDDGSGEFTLAWRVGPSSEPVLRLVVPRGEVRAVLALLARAFPAEPGLAIHPLPLKSLFLVAPTTDLDLVEIRPVIQALQATGEARFFEQESLAKYTYGDLVYIRELGILAELERPDRPRKFRAPVSMRLARSRVPSFLAEHQDDIEEGSLVLEDSLRPLRILSEFDRIEITPGHHGPGERSWYWLSVRYGFGNEEIDLREILAAKHERRPYVETGQGWVDVEAPAFRPLDSLLERGDVMENPGPGGALRLSANELLRLTTSTAVPVGVSDAGTRGDIVRRLLASEPSALLGELHGLAAPLRPYQRLGLDWARFLYENSLSGLLCDDMGLGKTHQAMALMVWLREVEPVEEPCLVVCPTTVISHWREKLRVHAPRLRVAIHHGTARDLPAALADADVLVTSYGVLRNDAVEMQDVSFALVVLDEAQHLKNRDTQAYRAACLLRAKMRLGLTGTPIENSLLDLKALFDLVLQGYLGTDAEFARVYTPHGNGGGTLLPDGPVLEGLRRQIAPFVLRRTKQAVLDELPDKIEDVRICQLSRDQVKLYRDALATRGRPLMAQLVEGATDGRPLPYVHIFALLTLLKRICNHPALLLGGKKGGEDEQYRSGKWDLFQELLSESLDSGQKVVVFSQFLDTIAMMARLLGRWNVGSVALTGSSRNRGEIVRRFNEDADCRVFVGSLKAGGTGIDLVGGSVVIHYDRWWNAAREDQATDRVHRIGQRRAVQVFKLVTEGTLEEKIATIIERKRGVMQSVVREDDQSLSKLFSREELMELLGGA